MHTQTIPDSSYREALKRTDSAAFDLPEPGSSEEATMLAGVTDLFTNYTRDNLESNLPLVYADEIYFRDAFKLLRSNQALRDYMVEGLEPLEGAEFVFNRIIRSGGEFYIDWVMRLDFKRTPPGSWEESIGMSHLRFNSEGRVIFHQDYWDPTDIVYRRIPIARQLIAYVKKKL